MPTRSHVHVQCCVMLTQLEASVPDVVTPGRLVGFGCDCAAPLMWSILTIDTGAFKVQHLASFPANRNTEAA